MEAYELGTFKGYEVWRGAPADCVNKVIMDEKGNMKFNGVTVGKANIRTNRVLSWDQELVDKLAMRSDVVPVVACVAETNTSVREDGTLFGADEFFARVTREIEEILNKSHCAL